MLEVDYYSAESELDYKKLPFHADEDFLALTTNQKRFIFAYLIKDIMGWTMIDCGRFASSRWDWDEINAKSTAWRHKYHPSLVPFIKQVDQIRLEQLGLSVERLVLEETCIAYSDLTNYIDDNGCIKDGKGLKSLPPEVRRCISSIEIIDTPIGPKTKISLWDKGSALKRLQNIKGLGNTKRLEVSGPDGGPIETKNSLDLSTLTNKELEILIKLTEKSNAGGPRE